MVRASNAALADRIGSARKDAGKTQQQIADALSIHVNQYQRLETGKHRVSVYDLTRIAAAIGIPAGDLLSAPPAQTHKPALDEAEFNAWKAKAISRGKLLERFRDLVMNMSDTVCNEGDRVYFGSTNDYHELREIGQQMDMWNWDAIIRERPERDPYADCRGLRAALRAIEAYPRLSMLDDAENCSSMQLMAKRALAEGDGR